MNVSLLIPNINDSSATINDSFDTDNINSKINLDVYEKSLEKLAQENKLLRRRVTKLTELARAKEQQLIEAFNQAVENKRKNEEISQIEHNAQLQSYYECFLQIEKENASLKSKIEQMREKLHNQQEKLDAMLREQNSELAQMHQQQQQQQTVQTSPQKQTSPKIATATCEIAEESGDDDGEEQHEPNAIDEPRKKQQIAEINRLSMKHIDEELSELNKTVKDFIKETVAQQQDEYEKTNGAENKELGAAMKQQRINELEMELDTLNNKLKNIEACLARWIFRACDYKLDLDKMNEKKELYEQQTVELEQTRAKLSESLIKVGILTNELEISKNQASKFTPQTETETQQTQTETLETHSEITQTHGIDLIDSSCQTEPIALPSVADQPVDAQKSKKPLTKAEPSPELAQLKTRIDNLILEKNSLRARNDELAQELDSANRKLTVTQATAASNKETQNGHRMETKSSQTVVKNVNALVQTDVATTTATRPLVSQTALKATLKSIEIQTTETTTTNGLRKEDDSQGLDQMRQEWDLGRIKLEKKLNEERVVNLKMSQDLDSLKSQVEREKQEWETKMSKLLSEFNQSKQISDTIINQQKKLLDYLQIRLKQGDEPSSHHHNLINIFNKKKIQKSASASSHANPLLAHLHKTTNQAFLNKQQELLKQNKILEQEKNQVPALTNGNGHHQDTNGDIKEQKSESKINEIVTELNSHYQTYSEMRLKQLETTTPVDPAFKTPNTQQQQSKIENGHYKIANTPKPQKQIHVFITGLNTCPTYCHVCQQIIPLIAYASKCQLCAFTCHSTCSASMQQNQQQQGQSRKSKSSAHINGNGVLSANNNNNNNGQDPLKFCNTSMVHSPMVGLEYNNYINKLIALGQYQLGGNEKEKQVNTTKSANGSNVLLNDYVYLDTNSKWKKVWLCLRMDEKQQEAKLDIYQSKSNLKPFDTINLVSDRIQIESNMKQIKKLCLSPPSHPSSLALTPVHSLDHPSSNNQNGGDNIYEELNDDLATPGATPTEPALPNFEASSLVLLLFNTTANTNNKLMLKIGFSSFNAKNIWYDALLSAMLVGRTSSPSSSAIGGLNIAKKQQPSQSNTSDQFRPMNVQKVLKPFLELYDTIVNSYCFINDDLLALACDDGLYALNSYSRSKENQQQNGGGNNVSLVKIDSVESAHKLYYENEFGKLCFIGRKSRQFLSIDVNELNACLINNNYKVTNRQRIDADDYDDPESEGISEDDDSKSIEISLENIHQIDRCHLFECKLNKSSGHWYLAVATPESISLLLFNKLTNKYTLVKSIQTQSEAHCICMKFTCNSTINQLVYACGREFFKMDIVSSQSSIINLEPQPSTALHQNNQPIAVCVISSPASSYQQQQEAILLCYANYGLFLVYNFSTQQWQFSNVATTKKSSSSSITSNGTNGISGTSATSASNLLQSNSMLKWPRGNCLTPLQIEYDSSYLYLFYNDCVIVYNVAFESDLALTVRKCGITFIYKPKYLSTFNNKTSNCVIISNRRLLDEEQMRLELEHEINDIDDDNETLIQDLNDKICLSYFSPASN